jgi:glucose/arabinose dehydrogenase
MITNRATRPGVGWPVIMLAVLTACGPDQQEVTVEQTIGPNPVLPEPEREWLPTVHVAEAVGWPADRLPVAVEGMTVTAYAADLVHPRWLYTLPNGDVLVAETNAPPRPDQGGGIRGWFVDFFQSRAGATTPSANRITLLRDENGDGTVDLRTAFLEGLNSPFGMSLVDNTFYVANTDAVLAFEYQEGATAIEGSGRRIADLPAGDLNHHWTKNIVAGLDGKLLYATVGSNSNVGENGLDKEENRAAILEIDPASGQSRIFAHGLRNPNGLAWESETGALWTVVNERDELGDNLVPDYLTSVTPDAFYGWPYSYFGQHVDERVEPGNPSLVAEAVRPDYSLGAHVAALGLTFSSGDLMPEKFRRGAFIGQHGSWNRSMRSGYNVVFVPFSAGKPSGMPVEVLGGFINEEDEAMGRPVGVTMAADGALLVADDVGNVVWRVAPSE